MVAMYKLPSAKGLNRFATVFWSLLVSALFSFVFFYSYLTLTTPSMLWTALVWGVSFCSLTLLQMYALTHVDTNVLFPITTTASLVVTVVSGMLFFGEYPTPPQLLGIILAIITIFLFLYKKGRLQYSAFLLSLGSGIILVSAFSKIVQKSAADNFDIHAFQVYQYIFAAAFSLVLYFLLHRGNWKTHLVSGEAKVGSLIGVFSFFGGYSLYAALTRGPFPLITSIHSLYILITALTAYFLFQEKLTIKKIFLLFVAILAVILIHIG